MGYVESLNSSGKRAQTQDFLKRLEHLLAPRLQDPETHVEAHLRITHYQIQQAGLRPSFRRTDVNPAAPALGEPGLQHVRLFNVHRNVDFLWSECVLQIILFQGRGKEFAGIEGEQVLPVELPAADNPLAPHGEHRESKTTLVLKITEQIGIVLAGKYHFLPFGHILDHRDPIPVNGRCFVVQSLCRFRHPEFQLADQLVRLPREKQFDVLDGAVVFRFAAKTGNAGPETALHLVVEAGPRKRSVDFQVACAQLEILVDQFDRPPRIARRKERAEIQSAVFLDAPRDEDSRIRLVHRELQIRETLVILEMDVVARLVLLDQRGREDQRFHFVVGKDVFQAGDFGNQAIRFWIQRAGFLEVRPNPAPQGAGFADINDFAPVVLIDVYPGRSGQILQLFLQLPHRHSPTPHSPQRREDGKNSSRLRVFVAKRRARSRRGFKTLLQYRARRA